MIIFSYLPVVTLQTQTIPWLIQLHLVDFLLIMTDVSVEEELLPVVKIQPTSRGGVWQELTLGIAIFVNAVDWFGVGEQKFHLGES